MARGTMSAAPWRATVVCSTVARGTVNYKTVAGGAVVYNSEVRHTISSLRCI